MMKVHKNPNTSSGTLSDQLDDRRRLILERPYYCVNLGRVFSEDECERLIQYTEEIGYEPALINAEGGEQVLDTSIRKSSRAVIDDHSFAIEITERIREELPTYMGDGFYLSGCSERMRFLKYEKGEYFYPHYDASYEESATKKTFITVQIYLNDNFGGGHTTFFPTDGRVVKYIPAAGDVLLFQHDILHEGFEVTRGIKYALRTDVFYSKTTS